MYTELEEEDPEALIQAAPEVLEEHPDNLIIDEENVLIVYIESTKPRCFRYG